MLDEVKKIITIKSLPYLSPAFLLLVLDLRPTHTKTTILISLKSQNKWLVYYITTPTSLVNYKNFVAWNLLFSFICFDIFDIHRPHFPLSFQILQPWYPSLMLSCLKIHPVSNLWSRYKLHLKSYNYRKLHDLKQTKNDNPQ